MLRPGRPELRTREKLVDEFVTVTDEELSRALLMLLERHKMVVEPAGGAAVAALMAGEMELRGPVVAILSGGNIDPMLLLRVIEHGLASAGRFLRLSVRCGDRPGELARLLARSPSSGPTWWTWPTPGRTRGCSFGEVEVALSVETRGPDHSDDADRRPALRRIPGDASRRPTRHRERAAPERGQAPNGRELHHGDLDVRAARGGVGHGLALAARRGSPCRAPTPGCTRSGRWSRRSRASRAGTSRCRSGRRRSRW